MMSSREIQRHNRAVFDQLEAGDLLEIKRGLYSHWAVYIGNGEIVHMAGENDDGINNVQAKHIFTVSGKTFNKASICVDLFWDVVAGCKVEKNNSKDRRWNPNPPDLIVENALSRLGEINYNAVFNNCEHFVTWCRYNVEKSDQADSFKTVLLSGLAVLATAGLVALLGSRNKDKRKY